MYKYKFVNKFTLILSLFIILILTTGISTKKDEILVVKYLKIYILKILMWKNETTRKQKIK